MPIFGVSTIIRFIPTFVIGASISVGAPAPTRANVITNWDENAVSLYANLNMATKNYINFMALPPGTQTIPNPLPIETGFTIVQVQVRPSGI